MLKDLLTYSTYKAHNTFKFLLGTLYCSQWPRVFPEVMAGGKIACYYCSLHVIIGPCILLLLLVFYYCSLISCLFKVFQKILNFTSFQFFSLFVFIQDFSKNIEFHDISIFSHISCLFKVFRKILNLK